MIFVVRKDTGEVVMRCDGDIGVDADIFDVVEYDPTDDELQKIELNYIATYTDGHLTLVINPHLQKEQEDQEHEEFIEECDRIASDKDIAIEDRLEAVLALVRAIA